MKAIKGSYTLDLPFRIPVNYETRVKLSGKQYAFKVDDGYLLTFNRGEFGGSLFWFSEDGLDHYEISGPPLMQVINRNGKLYGIEGLDHLGLSYGSMVEVLRVNQKWITKPYLKLPSAPKALQLDAEGNFIILTSDDFISVDLNRNIKTLASKGMWYPYLYPSSLVINEHIVYIGMRQGVYKYNLVTKKAEWLMLH